MGVRLALCVTVAIVAASCGSADDAAPSSAPAVTLTTAAPSRAAPDPTTTSAAPTTTTTTTLPPETTTTTSTTTTTTSTTTTPATTTTTTTTTTTLPPVTETACRSVVLIGDSTAVGLERADLTGALGRVGATDVRLEISGGRSMVERLGDQENAVQVAQRIAASGYVGCWVVVVGANDAANIAAGSNADAATRVTRMLDAIGGQPTIWLGATSVAGSGFWARPNIESWNTQVRNLLTASGNVVFADWDAAANANPWYVSDGIHPNADGSAAMASFIGDHLLFFYPQR